MSGTTRRDTQALLSGGMNMALLNRSAVIVKPLRLDLEWRPMRKFSRGVYIDIL